MNLKFWRRKSTEDFEFDTAKPVSRARTILRTIVSLISLYLLAAVGIGIWWSLEPGRFSVADISEAMATEREENRVNGYTTTATSITLAKTLLNKTGGYLTNDLFPPGIWLDNMPSWELGVLTLLRDNARVYRNDFSRSQSQSAENKNLTEAEAKFFFNNDSWFLPATENEYREGIRFFEAYLRQLADEDQNEAQFYARADNLQQWLAAMETRLGSLSQRLSASVGKRQLDTGLAGDSAATQSTASPDEKLVKTPWLEIDNVFYESRGFTWALIHMLEAIDTDFSEVLDKKAARVSLRQIIRELEPTQEILWSPMVLNGDGFGVLANHSLIMASHISRANAAIIDLRALLAQG
ncbi:MAG TPA: DUF2333 domain-containing protein [Gammaproteobacteria bacterium]|nr:DUF2333 domain-containing protein [Gammaproteobacteria bacterium]|tara:strand:- start:5630 stop:6688 length:1059 start_codon:yes stop_codon:yes gene_type:complete